MDYINKVYRNVTPEAVEKIEHLKNAAQNLIDLLEQEKLYGMSHNNGERIATCMLAIRNTQQAIFWGTYAITQPEKQQQ